MYHIISGWTSRLFPVSGYYEYSSNQYEEARISGEESRVIWVYASDAYSWILRQIYSQLSEGPPH